MSALLTFVVLVGLIYGGLYWLILTVLNGKR